LGRACWSGSASSLLLFAPCQVPSGVPPMIRFACPSCGFSLSAPDDCAGRASRCRQCGRPVIVPAQRLPARQPVPAPAPFSRPRPAAAPRPATVPAPAPRPAVATSHSRIPGRLLAIGAGVAALLLLVCGVVWLATSTNQPAQKREGDALVRKS